MAGQDEDEPPPLWERSARHYDDDSTVDSDDNSYLANAFSNEMFALDDESDYQDLDACIDEARQQSTDMFSIVDLVRGRTKVPNSTKRRKTADLKPIAFVRFNTRMGKAKPVTIKALLDSGGSGTLVTEKYAKKLRCKKLQATKKTVWTTPAGAMSTTRKCQAQFTIPELHDNRLISWDVHVTKSLGAYDMIIGRDILSDLGINIRFSDMMIEWDGAEIPLRDSDLGPEQTYYVNDSPCVEQASQRIKDILDAKYEPADLEAVSREATHLNSDEQQKLQDLLVKYTSLFDGTLGHWKGEDYEVELKPDAKPYHAKAYPIPKIHMDTLKMEVDRLCEVGVLKRVNRSEWAAPTFIIPKKDGTVRFISDFRELNKRIKRKPYPIPKIQDLLMKLEGFTYATSLDLNMGYYHVELSPDTKKLCTIILPFGKYEYQRLPMGLCNSPDIFQEKMSTLMDGLEFVRAYIDDLLCITNGSFEDHLEKLDEVFRRLREAGLKVNARKSFFARGEVEYLGYWVTRQGIAPMPKKVKAIQAIAEPKTKKQLRSFIGLVNYYRDMWVRRSHLLAPLAQLTSKSAKWEWKEVHRKSFQAIKKVISRETLLAYPDFNDKFVIHTDASHHQLGAVISQKGKPIAFYSRKLRPEQTRYTTTERELLSIVETLKEFRNILLGQRIEVHTDHKNLTCKNFNTERVMRWRLILEEYSPELLYIKGTHNIVADALSRLDLDEDLGNQAEALCLETMAELFAEDEENFPKEFPLSYRQLAYEQQRDNYIQQKLLETPQRYKKEDFKHGKQHFQLVTREGKIVVPAAMQKKTVEYYHSLLMHPGETRTELTIGQHFCWKGMRNTVKDVCSKCEACQLTKAKLRKLGHLPPKKEPEVIPWETLCIDLIGPYTIGKGKKTATLHCLTMIDPATGWFEIVEIPNKRADSIANLLEQVWLTRYPWPEQVVLDRGREFMGEVITLLKDEYGIKRNPITTRNPQANSMVERAHQTIHNLIRVQRIKSLSDLDTEDPWSGLLAAVAFAMRATVHTTTRATPSQLVFNRDALHNVRFEADWKYIKDRKQRLIVQNNKKENARRVPHTYQIGDQVLVDQDPQRKHGQDRYKGPFEVTTVHDNGTVTLRQSTNNGGAVFQTWNIRNIHPYKA